MVSDHPPVIRRGPTNQTVPVDSKVLLICEASGTPTPTIHWRRNGVPVSPLEASTSLVDSGSLQLTHTKVATALHLPLHLHLHYIYITFTLHYIYITFTLHYIYIYITLHLHYIYIYIGGV